MKHKDSHVTQLSISATPLHTDFKTLSDNQKRETVPERHSLCIVFETILMFSSTERDFHAKSQFKIPLGLRCVSGKDGEFHEIEWPKSNVQALGARACTSGGHEETKMRRSCQSFRSFRSCVTRTLPSFSVRSQNEAKSAVMSERLCCFTMTEL